MTGYLSAVVTTQSGNVIDLEGYAAVQMHGDTFSIMAKKESQQLPFGTELMLLPDRVPVAYNVDTGELEEISHNPYQPEEKVFPVAAFNSPGYVLTGTCAYTETPAATLLHLFSYGAVGWSDGYFYSAAMLVDPEPRQDLRQMLIHQVKAGVDAIRKRYPKNRLIVHLEKCALTYGCPAAKNFFSGRYEAPLPTSTTCNARCMGCISLQETSTISCCQERISFVPTPAEIGEIALFHIDRVADSVVSFGQGCEGEPLTAADSIVPAIQKIRTTTPNGTININTNAGLTQKLDDLWNAGLDSMRVSINSFQPAAYAAYFRPKGYAFEDVLQSIGNALARQKYVAINYLNCPGFTDSAQEQEVLFRFLETYPIQLIQWRNLNFDPLRYYNVMNGLVLVSEPMGMPVLLNRIRERFPDVRFGYFNPPKERFLTTGT